MVDVQDLLRSGNLNAALEQLQDQVREDPSNSKHRVFLFQLLSVLGQWDRALNQLNVLADLDAATLPMVQTYREALNCEAFRNEVFAGRQTPLVFGEPEEWIALVLEALKHTAEGHHQQAQALREKAFEEAPATSGEVDGKAFEWIADADPRMGPMLEVIVNGRYYWAPFHRIRKIELDAPEDLRDLIWMPAQFSWANGGQAVGLIPSRYPGSEGSEDGATRMARQTLWVEEGEAVFGLGQRLLATDGAEYALMDCREISLNSAPPADAEPAAENGDG
jgi:type VI secretion system protein ImpE